MRKKPRRYPILLILGLVFLLASSVVGCAAGYQKHFEQGNAHLAQGQWDEAIIQYTEAIQLNPEFADAYAKRAVAYLQEREYGLAPGNEYNSVIADCEKAIELNPLVKLDAALARAYVRRGDYYFEQWDYDEAIADYIRAMELDPLIECRSPAHVYAYRAERHLESHNYDQAIADFTQAIELDSGDNEYFYSRLAEAYCGRGDHYVKYWEPDKAIADFTKAIELDPDEAEYYYCRGETYYHLADYYWDKADYYRYQDEVQLFEEAVINLVNSKSKAIADFTRAIELEPEDAKVYFKRGQCYAGNGDYFRAAADFTKAIELGREDWAVYFNRACAYRELGDKNKALADYRKTLALTEDDFIREQSLKYIEELQSD